MGVTTIGEAKTPKTSGESPKVEEPTTAEIRTYILDETELGDDDLTAACEDVQANIPFLSAVAAYYLIAQRHELEPAEFFETKQQSYALDVGNLRPQMRSVDITASVKRITPINEFERDEGSDGKVCNIIVSDETGTAVVTLWDDDTAYASEFQQGDKLRIDDGYTKVASDFCQNRLGCEVELRVGDDGTLLKRADDEWLSVMD